MEQHVVADEMFVRFFAAMEDTRKTIGVQLERVMDKLEDVRANMVTPRDLEDVKSRVNKVESNVERIGNIVVSRGELDTRYDAMTKKIEAIDERLGTRVTLIETKQGRQPAWVWPTVISGGLSIIFGVLSVTLNHH